MYFATFLLKNIVPDVIPVGLNRMVLEVRAPCLSTKTAWKPY